MSKRPHNTVPGDLHAPLGLFSRLCPDALALVLSFAGVVSSKNTLAVCTPAPLGGDIDMLLRLLRTARGWLDVLRPCIIDVLATARCSGELALDPELAQFIDACLRLTDPGLYRWSVALSFVRLAQLEYEYVLGQVACMAVLDEEGAHHRFRPPLMFLYQVFYCDDPLGTADTTLALYDVPGVLEATGMNVRDVELREIWRLAGGEDASVTATVISTTMNWARKRARMYNDMTALYPLGCAGPLSLFCNVVVYHQQEDNDHHDHIYSPACDAFRAHCFYCGGEALRDDPQRRLRAIRLAASSARNHQRVREVILSLSCQ